MFIVLIEGSGEGCDYTIGCNKNWKKLEASTIEEAQRELKDVLDYYGGSERIEKFVLLRVDGEMEIEAEKLESLFPA